MDTITSNNNEQIHRGNRRALILTFVVFLLPVVTAYTVLKTGWYRAAGTANKGMLITPPIVFDDLELSGQDHTRISPQHFRKKWWILYVIPEHCAETCRNSLYQMRQVHKALGADQSRVKELIIRPYPVPDTLARWLQTEFPEAEQAEASPSQLNRVLQRAFPADTKPSQAGHLFLMDTLGAIFMHYRGYANEHESILKGRDLLKDLQRVLKYSKIG